MKKFIAVILSVCFMAAMLAGCGVSDPLTGSSAVDTEETTSESTQDEANEAAVKSADYEDSFKGLCDYFVAMGYTVEKAGDELSDSNVTEMDASLIGASEGKKFTTKYNGKDLIVELYVYDTDNLSDAANEIITSIQENGTFEILPDENGKYLAAITAYLSDSGKYLMIYTDSSIDDSKPDTSSDNYTHREQVIKDFKAFHK